MNLEEQECGQERAARECEEQECEEGAARAISAVCGQEWSEEQGAAHVNLVRATEGTELEAWKYFGVAQPLNKGELGEVAVDTQWVLTWKMLQGVKTVKARLVARGF